MTATYVIPGAEVTGLERFWQVMGEAVNGPDGYFGRNLDAFADCLGGGFGTPTTGTSSSNGATTNSRAARSATRRRHGS